MNNKGFVPALLLVIAAVIVVGIGGYVALKHRSSDVSLGEGTLYPTTTQPSTRQACPAIAPACTSTKAECMKAAQALEARYKGCHYASVCDSCPTLTDKTTGVPAGYLLPNATVGQRYSSSLTWNGLSATPTKDSTLPPGLSIQEIALPCAPPASGGTWCPNEYNLAGIPTRAGTYTFGVEFRGQEGPMTERYSITVR